MIDDRMIANLNALVGNGYAQPCFVCLGILGKHEPWCDREQRIADAFTPPDPFSRKV